LSPGPSRRFTESHTILVVRRGAGGDGNGWDGEVTFGGSETDGETPGGAGLGGGSGAGRESGVSFFLGC